MIIIINISCSSVVIVVVVIIIITLLLLLLRHGELSYQLSVCLQVVQHLAGAQGKG